MSPHIQIQWLGVRKDGARGSVWAWFTETGKQNSPYAVWRNEPPKEHISCHVIWGGIGKRPQIIEYELTEEFLTEARVRANNFKQADPEKIISKWGKAFDEELSMYLLMLKMKG